MPLWPVGFTGSITHSDGLCVAAVAATTSLTGLGIDLERLDEVDSALAPLICGPEEMGALERIPLGAFFSAKESVFKCQYPLTGEDAEFSDASIRFGPNGTFSVRVDDARFRVAERFVGRIAFVGPYVLTAAWLT